MSYLLTRGQSIKVFSQILRKARHRGYIIPNIKYSGPSNGGEGVAYEGATVLDPKVMRSIDLRYSLDLDIVLVANDLTSCSLHTLRLATTTAQ